MIARSRIAFMIAALSIAPSFAEAADLGPYRPPEPEPVYSPPEPVSDMPMRYNWTGLYLGINAGYGWGESIQSDDPGLATSDPEGFMGAVTLGANYQTPGGFLIGLEGDIGLMDVSADHWWGTLRGRAGFAFDRTLLYATAGLAFMDIDEVSTGSTPGETAWNEDFDTGWAIGGGIEHALSSNISLKLEYLHMDFGEHEGYSANNEAYSFNNDVDLVRAGINFKF